jgi:hypothetical protein
MKGKQSLCFGVFFTPLLNQQTTSMAGIWADNMGEYCSMENVYIELRQKSILLAESMCFIGSV